MDDLIAFIRARLDDNERDPGGWSRERVLREVEAKRGLLDEHAPRTLMAMGHDLYSYPGEYCGMCSPRNPNARQRYPCRTLRLLALPYADHPDYREEWKPNG